MEDDEKPEKQKAVSVRRKRMMRGVWIACAVLVLALGIALILRELLPARETPHRSSCQYNQAVVDSAVQQYILEFGLKDQAEFVALFGTEQKDWSHVLVGPDKYIRYPPKCPTHKSSWMFWKPLNDYSIAPTNAGFEGGGPAKCNVCDLPYPQADP